MTISLIAQRLTIESTHRYAAIAELASSDPLIPTVFAKLAQAHSFSSATSLQQPDKHTLKKQRV